MLFFQYLYALVIGPLELVFKIIFSILNKYIPFIAKPKPILQKLEK